MSTLHRRAFLASLLPLAACACSDDEDCEDIDNRAQKRECLADRNGDNPTKPSPVPEPPAPPPPTHTFEFRVVGTVGRVDISHTSTTEGTTLVRSNLPWFATIRSARTLMFLSLTAAALDTEGTLTVQLFVDGVLFREAHATGFAPTATISGQWMA
jgi:hypothetical protein